MKIKIKKLHPEARLPTYATDGSGCFDIYSDDWCDLSCTRSQVIETGLAFEIPEGYVMLVFSRSGHAFKNDVRLANCVGVIDSDYRGELKIKLTRDSAFDIWNEFAVARGDRIAQALIVPIPKVSFEEVDELSNTARGTGGLGSTGD